MLLINRAMPARVVRGCIMKHLRVGVLAGLMLLAMLLAMLLGMTGGRRGRLAAAEPGRPTHFSAYLGLLPGLIDSNGTGPFVDLVKAIAGLDDGVEVSVMVYPMSRATRSVVVGEADSTCRRCAIPTSTSPCCPIASARRPLAR